MNYKMKKTYITPSLSIYEMTTDSGILVSSPGSMGYSKDEYIDEENTSSILSTGGGLWNSFSSSSAEEVDE